MGRRLLISPSLAGPCHVIHTCPHTLGESSFRTSRTHISTFCLAYHYYQDLEDAPASPIDLTHGRVQLLHRSKGDLQTPLKPRDASQSDPTFLAAPRTESFARRHPDGSRAWLAALGAVFEPQCKFGRTSLVSTRYNPFNSSCTFSSNFSLVITLDIAFLDGCVAKIWLST